MWFLKFSIIILFEVYSKFILELICYPYFFFRLRSKFIKWPSEAEGNEIVEEFYRLANFPGMPINNVLDWFLFHETYIVCA